MLSVGGKGINVIDWGMLCVEIPEVNKDAEIEINGKLHKGDVVFTVTIRDYYKKNMHLNSRFNKCILHVAEKDEFTNLRIRTQSCKPISTVIVTNKRA